MVSGKHVFCEKSITVNSRQLEECVAIAQEKGLVICDGMTLLHMPLYKELKKKIAEGAIGDVKMVQVNLGSCKEYDVKNRFFSKELAGGALLDIGVYATSFARYFMKSKPDVVLTTANYFETGVDETSEILLKNPDGEMAVMALTMCAKQPKRGVVAGEKGFIEIYDYPRAAKATITYTESGKTEVIEAGESAKAPQILSGDIVAMTFIGKLVSVFVTIYTIFVVAIVTGVVVNYYGQIVEMQRRETAMMFLDKLERLPELSKEDLEDISKRVQKFR